MAPQQTVQQNQAQPYPREIAVASSPDVASASVAAGVLVSAELRQALDQKQLSLRVERLLDIGETKSAVFSVVYQPQDKEGRALGEPVVLKPPVVVHNVDGLDYVKRKQDLLVAALEKHAANLPLVVALPRDAQQAFTIVIDPKTCPNLWQELANGATLDSKVVRSGGNYAVSNIELVSKDGIKSNIVGVYQSKMSGLPPILEFEASRIADLRARPDSEEQIRARFIGSRGMVFSDKNLYVTTTTELGNYYCEAMMFVPQCMAEYEHGCSILKNIRNEPLNGFMHIPRDSYSTEPKITLSDSQLIARHQKNSEVLGTALLGYLNQALEVNPELTKFKLLLTGYHGHVSNNPSGEFAISTEPVARALNHAFGSNLTKVELLSENLPLKLSATIVYHGREMNIEIVGQSFPVNSTTLDFGKDSVQRLIRDEKPQAVIGLGVDNPRGNTKNQEWFYEAGTNSDNALLLQIPALKNAYNLQDGFNLPENHSLPGAIYTGDQLLRVRNRQDR